MPANNIAIDFGSSLTNIYKVGSGLVLSEPTVAAISDDEKNEIKAVGEDAKKIIGKTTKNTKTVFPVFEGEIVNEKVASNILNAFLKKIDIQKHSVNCSVLFSVPCGVTKDMIEKLYSVAKNCGFSKVYYAESPVLSALGQRIPLNDSNPCFVIDLDGGVTNIAAVTLDGVIAGVSVNFGGNKLSADIIDFILDKYGLQIGLLSAEKIKKEIASLEENDALRLVVNGRDALTGTPKAISVRAMDVRQPIKEHYDKIADIATSVLKKLPPEVSAEIRHSGLYLSGEGASVYGLQEYYEDKFEMPINICSDPTYSVALGGGAVVGDKDLLKKIAQRIG